MSTVRATNFQNAGSASVNMTLDTAGNATVANTLAMGSSFLRNRIINGDMRIDQRNAGASVTPTVTAYTLDRWRAVVSQSSKYSVQQSSTAPTGHVKSLLVTSLSAYSVGTGDFFIVDQPIEGFNVSDLGFGAAGAQSVTLSFWTRSSLTGTFGGALVNGGATRSYPFSYTISSANTWEFKTITIAGDTSGTWPTNNTLSMLVRFGLGAGSTYTGTAGAWVGSSIVQPTGSTSVVGTNAATWYITGVQLEPGTVATPFERRQYGQELALCQRYYEVGDAELGCYATNGSGIGTRASFKQTKRAAPTLTLSNVYMANTTQNGSYDVNVNGFFPVATATATGMVQFWYSFTASAEL